MITKTFKYLGKYKKFTFLATIMVIAAVVAQILPYFFVAQLISPLIMGEAISRSFAVSKIVLVLVFLVINFVLYLSGLSLSHIAAFNTLANIRSEVQKKMESLPLGVIQDKGIGRLKKLLVDDIESLELLLAHAIPEGLGNSIVPVAVFVALFIVDWKLALLTLAVLPLALFAMSAMMHLGMSRMDSYYKSAQKMNNTIIEYVNGMEVVKVFNKDKDSYKRYGDDVKSYRDFTLDWYKACWPWMAIYAGLFACTALFTMPFGGMLVAGGSSTMTDFIVALCLSFSVGAPILKSMHFIPSLLQIDRKIGEIEATVGATSLRTSNKPFMGNSRIVEYKNVSFAYEDTNVLENVSLTFKEGQKTALVGESGSGKSTLAKLLVHYYDVNNGSISLGGQDITDMSLESLNNEISFVSQDQFLFNTSIYDNIKIGKPDATESEVLAAAEKAQCNEFIVRFEKGIHTLAGDCGNQLSGGERQRVSLARAILKNAPIVVLDEATAFADPENEEKMENAIAEVVKNKTLIVIAHRISSIIDSDNIYVMDKGKVAAYGTHGELLEKCELYARLWNASEQASGWKVETTQGVK